MTKTLKADLLLALAGIRSSIEKGWHKGGFARGASGQRVEVYDKKACSFCLAGAIMHQFRLGTKHAFNLEDYIDVKVNEATARRGFASKILFNDNPRTYKMQVLDLLDEVKTEIEKA